MAYSLADIGRILGGGRSKGSSNIGPSITNQGGGDIRIGPLMPTGKMPKDPSPLSPDSQEMNPTGTGTGGININSNEVVDFFGNVLTDGALAEIEAARENNRIMQQALARSGQISKEMYDRNIAYIDKFYGEAAVHANEGLVKSGMIDQNTYNNNISTINTNYAKASDTQQPFYNAGIDALKKQTTMLDEYGKAPDKFVNEMGAREAAYTPGEFNFQITPELQQKIDAARNSVETSASAKGLLGSSGALKAINQNTADIAQQGINEQFRQFIQKEDLKKGAIDTKQDLYTTDRAFNKGIWSDEVRNNIDALTRKYAGLTGITGIGQQAAANLGNIATGQSTALTGAGQHVGDRMADRQSQYNNNLGNLGIAQGNALAGQGTTYAGTQSDIALAAANATAAKNNAVAGAKGGAGSSILDKILQVAPVLI